jgi:hypothetical protein
MKYNIKITYDTGDTENRYPNQVREIPLEVEDIKLARKALLAIKEHKELEDSIYYSWDREKIERVREEIKQKEWYAPGFDCMKFDIGNGKYYQLHTFWHGVFERITRAEIIVAQPEVNKEINSIEF